MCQEIMVGDRLIQSLAEMREWVGSEPVYEDPDGWYGPQTPGDYCLCGINLQATAMKMGGVAEWSDDGWLTFARAAAQEKGGG